MPEEIKPTPENEKDWLNPAYARIYSGLAVNHALESDTSILNWLCRNGFGSLTSCPECHEWNFNHTPSCQTATLISLLVMGCKASGGAVTMAKGLINKISFGRKQ